MEKTVVRGGKKLQSEKDVVAEVLTDLLRHDALPACESRDDLEMIVHRVIPDSLWARIQAWGVEKKCGVGEALWRHNEELECEIFLQKVGPKLEAIFFDKDGSRRPDADKRLDLAFEMAEAENPEAVKMFNRAVGPLLASLPEDGSGIVPEANVRSFLGGLESARITKAHIALAQVRSCLGTPYLMGKRG